MNKDIKTYFVIITLVILAICILVTYDLKTSKEAMWNDYKTCSEMTDHLEFWDKFEKSRLITIWHYEDWYKEAIRTCNV